MEWIKTNFKGVRYREHPTRKHGAANKDRYFTIRYQRDGKRVEEPLGWASELDPKDQKNWTAEKAALVLAELKEAARGLKQGPTRLSERRDIENERKETESAAQELAEKEKLTFGQYFETVYLPAFTTGRSKDAARKGEEHFNKWIQPVIGNIPLKDVKPIAIERIKKNILDAGRTPRTLQYVFATIRQAWNMARRDGRITGDPPTGQVKIPKVDNKRVRFLSHKEAETLLNALQAKDPLTHNLTLLSLHSGMRMGEIADLRWSHINLERGIITVMDTKSGKGRVVFMTGRVKAMIETIKRREPDDYIFTRGRGERLDDTPKIFAEIVENLGFNEGTPDRRQRVCFHTCRHTFASWHVSAGTDLYTVKELLGHSVIAMTERYSHLAPGTLKAATQNLEKALAQTDKAEQAMDIGGADHGKG